MAARDLNVRPEKAAVVAEIRERIVSANCAMLVEFKAMTVDKASDMRTRLRAENALVFVCKNRLIGAAVKDEPFYDQWKPALNGSTLLVTGSGDAVATAKLLDKVCKDNSEVFDVKCAMLDKAGLSADEFKQLAALPSKEELQAKLVGTLVAPMRNLVGVLGQKTASIVHVIRAIKDKKEAA
jgi:large subunit ribosomal protein L10